MATDLRSLHERFSNYGTTQVMLNSDKEKLFSTIKSSEVTSVLSVRLIELSCSNPSEYEIFAYGRKIKLTSYLQIINNSLCNVFMFKQENSMDETNSKYLLFSDRDGCFFDSSGEKIGLSLCSANGNAVADAVFFIFFGVKGVLSQPKP